MWERARLITCSVAKSSSWERVGFLHNFPHTNYISSLYVAGSDESGFFSGQVVTVDGGIVTVYFYKRKGSIIINITIPLKISARPRRFIASVWI